jgi:general secretion pathway protein G
MRGFSPAHRQRQRGSRRNDAGFTLVEILVVITILGILVAVVSPQVVGAIDRAKVAKAQFEINSFSEALERYAIDMGTYPTSEEGLDALYVQPESALDWQGPYLKGFLKPDPWGAEYIYIYPGEHEDIGFPFDLMSYGKDGREGGTGRYDTDIANWTMGMPEQQAQ